MGWGSSMRSNLKCCRLTWSKPSAMPPSHMCCQKPSGPCSTTQLLLSLCLRCHPWLTPSSTMCSRSANAQSVQEVVACSSLSPMTTTGNLPQMDRLLWRGWLSYLQKGKKNPPTTADSILTRLAAALMRDRPTSGPPCLRASGPEPAQPRPVQTRGSSNRLPAVAQELGTG